MKQKIMLLAVIIISVLLAACSHFTMNNATVSGRDIVGTRTLTISIAENDYYKPTVASSGARTIVPDAFEDTGLKFYMYGEATNGEKLYPVEITNKVLRGDDGVKGKIKMDMEAYNWDLTLACTDSAAAALTLACDTTHSTENFNADIRNIEAKAVLIAHTSVDMQYSTNVNFVLTPRGLVNPSTLNFDLYSTGWQLSDGDTSGEINIKTGYTITAGIYDFITGVPVDDAASPRATTVKDTITLSTTEANDKFKDAPIENFATDTTKNGNYQIASMTPGTYTFKVTFTQTATGLKSVWSDTIIVLPGVNHRLSIGIPNVIGKLPVAPASFTAKYIKDSEDDEIDYYVAQLDWTDSSNNETHFEIDFVELENHTADDNIVTPTDEPSWNTALEYGTSTPKDTETVMIYGVDSPATMKGNGIYAHYTPFSGSALQKEGSLIANNTSVKIRLALGRRYIARIWSVNDSGRSTSAAYLTFDDSNFDAEHPTEYTDTTTNITYGKFTSTTMNRYRVTYYLQDGLWYPRGTKNGAGENPYADEPWTLDQIRYECQEDTTGNAIIAPFGREAVTTPIPAAAVPLLVRGAFRWYAWNIDVGADATPYDDKDEYVANYPAADAAIEDYYVTPHNYKGFDNLDLYAAYNNVAGYEIYDDSAYIITDAMIKVNDTALTSGEIADKKIIVNKNSASNVVFTLTPPGTGVFASPFEYEYVRLKITKGNTVKFDETNNHVYYYPAGTDPVTAEEDQSASFTVPVNNLVTGFYPATFTAKYGTTIVSYSFVIEIINE